MNLYMTTGTYDYMRKLLDKYPKETMVLMQGENTTLVVHETEKKTVFATPRRYEIIGSAGELNEKGYFVFNNIPVTEEGRPVFEHRFKNRAGAVENEPGFIAFRLLRPVKSDTYVVLTEWESPAFFEKWKESQSFSKAHAKSGADSGHSAQNIFAGSPYITTYWAKPEDE